MPATQVVHVTACRGFSATEAGLSAVVRHEHFQRRREAFRTHVETDQLWAVALDKHSALKLRNNRSARSLQIRIVEPEFANRANCFRPNVGWRAGIDYEGTGIGVDEKDVIRTETIRK
jgi:hypothetical protein